MKKALSILSILFIAHLGFAQKSTISAKKLKNDTIVWRSDSGLVKDDFKGKKQGPANSAGVSWVGICLFPQENNGTIIFNVEAIFLKSKSWLKDESVYTLKHEQLHFDIAELYARKLRKMISDKDFKKVKDIRGEIQRMYDKISAELAREEEKYDNDTEHGMNPAKQKVWDDDIPKQLAALSAYATISVNIVK